MEITAQKVKELREITGAGMMDCKKALTENNGDMDKAIDYLREKGIAASTKRESKIAAEGLSGAYIKDNKAVIIEINSETDFVSKNKEFQDLVDLIGNLVLNNEVSNIEDAFKLEVEGTTLQDYFAAKTAKIGEKLDFRRFVVLTKTEEEVFADYVHMGGKITSLVKIKGNNEEVAKDIAMHYAAMNPKYLFVEDITENELEKEKAFLKEQAMEEGKPAEIAEKMVMGRLNKFYKENCLVEQDFIKDDSKTIAKYLKENDSELLDAVRFEVGEGIEKKVEDFKCEVLSQIE